MHAASRTRAAAAVSKPQTKLLVGAHQLYEGPVLAGNVPHGVGAVLFSDGSLMIAEFVNGTPGGDCVVVSGRGAVRAQLRRGQAVPFEISACVTAGGGVVLTAAKSTSQSQYVVCNLRENTGALVQMTLVDRPDRDSTGLAAPEVADRLADTGIDVQIESLEKQGLSLAEVRESVWREVFGPVQSHSHPGTRTDLAVDRTRSGRCWVGLDDSAVLGASLQVEPTFEFVSGTSRRNGSRKPTAGLYLGPHTPAGGLRFTHLSLDSADSTGVDPEQVSGFWGCTASLRSGTSAVPAGQQSRLEASLADHGLVLHGEGVVTASADPLVRQPRSQLQLGLWHQGAMLSVHPVPEKTAASKVASQIIGRMHQRARAVDRLGVDISPTLAGQLTDEAFRIMKHWIQPASGIRLLGSATVANDQTRLSQGGVPPTAGSYCNDLRPDGSNSIIRSKHGTGRTETDKHKQDVTSGLQRHVVMGNAAGAPQTGPHQYLDDAHYASDGVDWFAAEQMAPGQLSPGKSIERDTLMWSVQDTQRLNTIHEAAVEEDLRRSKDSLPPASARWDAPSSRAAELASREAGRAEAVGTVGSTDDEIADNWEDWLAHRQNKLAWAQQVSARLDALSSRIQQQIASSRTNALGTGE